MWERRFKKSFMKELEKQIFFEIEIADLHSKNRKRKILNEIAFLGALAGGLGRAVAAAARAGASAARATGRAIQKGAQATGRAIKKGAQVTGQAIKKGAQVAGQVIKKGAQVAGQALARGARFAGQAIKTGAKTTGKTINRGIQMTEKATRAAKQTATRYANQKRQLPIGGQFGDRNNRRRTNAIMAARQNIAHRVAAKLGTAILNPRKSMAVQKNIFSDLRKIITDQNLLMMIKNPILLDVLILLLINKNLRMSLERIVNTIRNMKLHYLAPHVAFFVENPETLRSITNLANNARKVNDIINLLIAND